MFIETSRPRKLGDKATLKYTFPRAVSTGCLTLYYHMYGGNVGTLTVSSTALPGHV